MEPGALIPSTQDFKEHTTLGPLWVTCGPAAGLEYMGVVPRNDTLK